MIARVSLFATSFRENAEKPDPKKPKFRDAQERPRTTNNIVFSQPLQDIATSRGKLSFITAGVVTLNRTRRLEEVFSRHALGLRRRGKRGGVLSAELVHKRRLA